MSREERRWCLLLSLLLMAITSVPYLVAFQVGRGSWTFTGFLFGVGDGNSYIAKMLQGQAGQWLFQTPYSSERSPGVLAFLPYLLLGKLASGRDLHTQLVALFHMARLALVPVAVIAIYRFAALFLPQVVWRRWATALSAIGGGLGWLLVLTGHSQVFDSLPLDFYSPESFGFLALFGLPHLLLAKALLLFALTAYLDGATGLRGGVTAGAMLLALGLVQPITLVSAYAACGVHIVVLILVGTAGRSGESIGPWLKKVGLTLGVSLPLFLYYAAGSQVIPVLRQWAAQNILPSPNPANFVIAYALVLVPAFLGLRDLLRTQTVLGWFLGAWTLVLLLLAYAPVTVQRRLVEGAWVALCILAARGLSTIPLRASQLRVLAGALLGLSVLTSLVLLGGGIQEALHPAPPLFLAAEEAAAFEWIADHAEPDSVVLAAFDTGNALPAWAPVRSVIGHGPETAHLAEIQPLVERFFSGEMNDAAADSFLRDQRVDLVFLGPLERQLGEWVTRPTENLTPVYDASGYLIYAVGQADG